MLTKVTVEAALNAELDDHLGGIVIASSSRNLTLAALDDARQSGTSTGVLHSSPQAQSLYSSLLSLICFNLKYTSVHRFAGKSTGHCQLNYLSQSKMTLIR